MEASNVSVLAASSVDLSPRNGCRAAFDNIQFTAHDPKTATFAYNGPNELTTMTEGGVTTTYTYDDWGRTISKADGTHSATYGWRFGDKLRTYASTFPGEADVNFQYDGLGKRRMKLTNPSAPTDADRTWYRWDAGWNVIGEYAAGTDTGTTWDVGALTRWYQGKTAHADGDPDSTAYNYYAHDHLGSARTTYSQGQAELARIEFTPYGSPMTTTGQDMDLSYTGHKWDAETGSFYAPYRYYSPATERWMSRDPLGMVDGPNVYGYVKGNPIQFHDKLGLYLSKAACREGCRNLFTKPSEIQQCYFLCSKLRGNECEALLGLCKHIGRNHGDYDKQLFKKCLLLHNELCLGQSCPA